MAEDSKEQPITISRAALRVELLELEIRLKEYFDTRLANKAEIALVTALEHRLESIIHMFNTRIDTNGKAIQVIQENNRLDKERVVVAAQTLAAETERRREVLAGQEQRRDRKWSKTQWLITTLVAVTAIVVTYYVGKYTGG